MITFCRENKFITAKIINTVTEPLGSTNKRQVVFFCEDENDRCYRVPKSEVVAKASKVKNDKKKVKAKKSRRERRKKK